MESFVLDDRRGGDGSECEPSPGIVRRYGFGPSSVIRDRKTGRTTRRVDRVLGGEIDLVADL